jgi:hypothetical protein
MGEKLDIHAIRANRIQRARHLLHRAGYADGGAATYIASDDPERGGETGGMIEPGNLDIYDRKPLHNPDGTTSTTSSISVGTDKGETLIPTVVDGKRLSNDAAVEHYHESGQHLGVFKTPEDADSYATRLHNKQADHMGLGRERGGTVRRLGRRHWRKVRGSLPQSSTWNTISVLVAGLDLE